ncbi:hypothetical protein [Paenibacillus sp. UNC451MF]|nr:hypothetical protein [Paenibacillus sp. UNC451MF]
MDKMARESGPSFLRLTLKNSVKAAAWLLLLTPILSGDNVTFMLK